VEGTLTVRPREVNLVLLLLLAGLLSVPLALEPAEAWAAFTDFAKVVTMFIVMVNVVRSEGRWRWMFWLALLVSLVLSVHALNDYRLGNLKLKGDRVEGVIGGMFENPNDMALHLVTIIPLALALMYVTRKLSGKIFYALCALLMIAGTVVSFSRGGFLGLMCASFLLAWKIGRRNRLFVVLLFLVAGAIFLAVAPSGYVSRLLTIFGDSELDGGSAIGRRDLLIRSIYVTIANPLLGVGMNNFHIVSIHEKVSHNAYTQVSAEMGLAAMVVYLLFIITSFKRMRLIERETYETRQQTGVYYLAVGLQASLVAYMVSSFFASVAYLWYIYYLAGYALCLHRLYEARGAANVFSRTAQAGGGTRSAFAATEQEPPAQLPESLAAHRQKFL
jgi:O-antigen ligase